jgi:hypothetical protein
MTPRTRLRQSFRPLASERGTTLVETSIASAILLVALAGLLSMGSLATMHTENQGHLTPRTTEYAQDKMEQLLALAYTDTTSNTIVFPAAASGGTGLTVGGSTDTSSPANGYVDWLGMDGGLLGGGTAAPDGWQYQRVWQITSPSTGIKQIKVVSRVRASVGNALTPKSTVVALKSSQF